MPSTFHEPAVEIVVDGKPYRVSAIRMGEVTALQAFVSARPRPAAPVEFRVDPESVREAMEQAVDLATIPPEKVDAHLVAARANAVQVVTRLVRQARASAEAPDIMSEQGIAAILRDPDSMAELAALVLAGSNEGVSVERGREIFRRMPLREFNRLLEAAFQQEDAGPKAGGS